MSTSRIVHHRLPQPAPARVLASGAHLKNTACLVDGHNLWLSPVHGDLSGPEACAALDESVALLVAQADGPIDAIAHDLHPDFHSTRVAAEWGQRLRVRNLAVQHHHAHIAAVQAEAGVAPGMALVGLALDGVGLGLDGTAWGGEVLCLQGAQCQRVAHLPALALPGGDVAAREPWRLAAAALHALGRGDEIVPRFGPRVGEPAAKLLHTMLQRGLNCPTTTAAGRWFDAAAGALGLSLRQGGEAEAAIALEEAAARWLAAHPQDSDWNAGPALGAAALDLGPTLSALLQVPPSGVPTFDETVGRAAAGFHRRLAQGLVQAAALAANASGAMQVALGGGCFFNRILSRDVTDGLQTLGLQVLRPRQWSCGDAGLAVGQAWAAALQIQASRSDTRRSAMYQRDHVLSFES